VLKSIKSTLTFWLFCCSIFLVLLKGVYKAVLPSLPAPAASTPVLCACKGSAKFRFSEENENIFSFLSVRKLIKLSKIQNKFVFIFIFEMQPTFSKGECYVIDLWSL